MWCLYLKHIIFFSVGRDKVLKYWDADTFEQILTLEGHHQEIWGLAVTKQGDTVFTSSTDRSIRSWIQTEDQVFLEEEKERELEKMFEESTIKEKNLETQPQKIGDTADHGLEGDIESELVVKGRATKETLYAGERIIEALDLAKHEEEQWKEYKLM